MSSRQKIVLFFVILVFPALLSLVTVKTSFSRAKTVDFCASCHTMTPWIEDVTGGESGSLAGDHFANRWIQHDQCYSCHSNYNFLGPLKAKIRGMQHVVAFYAGHEGPIELFEDFPNANCLQCHEQAKGFREESSHEPLEELLSGATRCVECHDSFHNVEQNESSDESPEGDGTDDDREDDGAGDEAPAKAAEQP